MNSRSTSFLLLLLLFMSTQASAIGSCTSLDETVASGKNVVVLFVSDEETKKFANSQDDGESEFYSDWNFYLGSFLKDQSSKVAVCKLSVADGQRLFNSDKMPKDEWSIAFMKKGRPILYSAEPVMEPDAFHFSSSYFNGKEDQKDASHFGFSYVPLRGD